MTKEKCIIQKHYQREMKANDVQINLKKGILNNSKCLKTKTIVDMQLQFNFNLN